MADKIKKLSDAIRLGATFHPQCRRFFRHTNDCQTVTKTCALGAAMAAVGLLEAHNEISLVVVQKRFPEVPENILEHVMMLNDHPQYEWSRETIANWLDEQGY